ncbi:MAG: FecR domain-containing protein [Chloracidobacterium sp.]|nr:FecR domain-containing protein [Chloracidobacterium sp.]MBK8303797.1 FecR domain-containing protein [Chloracidobacterium sp.]
MDDNNYRKFYVDWWNIRKSTIYGLIAAVVLLAALGGGLWYASRNNWFIPKENVDIPKDAARIISFEGEVRVTRAATRETILVTKETFVMAGDTIQTQADGRASIQMIDGSSYKIGPNSTVVVKDTTSLFGGKNVRVSLDDGQLNVRTDDQTADARNIVEVADSENQLMPKTDASFNADGANGGEIRISRGGVETTIGGEKTIIGENEFASVNNGKLSARERLMAAPRPLAPSNSAQIVDTGGGVSAAFTWQDAEGNPAKSYYVQVARSPIFASDSILVDRSGLTAREFRLSGLSPGTYYWRIKATAVSGQVTNWNDAWKFMVVRAGESQSIDATDFKVERVGGNVHILTGRTRPGMIVRAAGRDTFAGPDGAFKLQISTPSIELAVEVGDDRGNRTGFIISLRNGAVLRRY